MSYDGPEAREVSEILDVVATKVPEMLTNILKTVYSEEAGRNVGQAVAGLYRELIAAGIQQDIAQKMASDYMISFKDIVGAVNTKKGSASSKSEDHD